MVRVGGVDDHLAAWTGGPKAELGLLAIVVFSSAAWIVATILTRPVSAAHLARFYRKVRPGGAWGPVAQAVGVPPTPLRRDVAMWLVSTVLVFAGLFGIGSFLLGRTSNGVICAVTVVASALALRALLRSESAAEPRGTAS